MQEPTFAPGHGPDAAQSKSAEQADYFGFTRTEKFVFPDGITFIEFCALNEGAKKDYQDRISSDMVLERKSGDARMSVKQGSQRHELIKAACVDWNLKRGDQIVPFNKIQLSDWLTLTDPLIVEDLEKAIRKANPWLMADMKSEDIRREIENLEEMYEVAKKREEGEAS